MRLHIVEQNTVPSGGCGHIGVEEHHIFIALGKSYSTVVAFGKP